MKKLYFLGLCMIISCSSFLTAELPADACKWELFNNTFSQAAAESNEKGSTTCPEEDEFDLEEWKREYLNMRTAVGVYLRVSSFINPYIIEKFFKKEFFEARPIKMLPLTKGQLICFPIDAVIYIAGVKYINNKYPLKELVKEAAVSASKEVAQSIAFSLTDRAITYLPTWSQPVANIGLKPLLYLAMQKLH